MTGAPCFISYSRRDYYSAEAVAISLEEQRIPVWFDNFRLRPGEPWESQIQKALLNAGVVLVIHSRSSARSDFVSNEIEAARSGAKRVVIARVDSSPLRPELTASASAIVDMRWRFRKRLGLLSSVIDGHRSVQQTSRFPLLPPMVGVVLLALIVQLAFALAALATYAIPLTRVDSFGPGIVGYSAMYGVVIIGCLLVLPLVYVAIVMTGFVRKFIHRDFVLGATLGTFGTYQIYRSLDLLIDRLEHGGPPLFMARSLLPTSVPFLAAGAMIGGVAVAVLCSFSFELLRWSKAGTLSPRQHRRFRTRLLPDASGAQPLRLSTIRSQRGGLSFAYSPDDDIAAEWIGSVVPFRDWPRRKQEVTGIELSLVSDRTGPSLMEAQDPSGADAGRRVVVVIASPGPVRQARDYLTTQWHDLRDRSDTELGVLAQALEAPLHANIRSTRVPESLATVVLPRGVLATARLLSGIAGYLLGASISVLVLAPALDIDDWSFLLAMVGIGMAGAALWSVRRVQERTLTVATFKILYFVSMVMFAFSTPAVFQMLDIPVGSLTVLFVVAPLLGAWAWFRYGRPDLLKWLPRGGRGKGTVRWRALPIGWLFALYCALLGLGQMLVVSFSWTCQGGGC